MIRLFLCLVAASDIPAYARAETQEQTKVEADATNDKIEEIIVNPSYHSSTVNGGNRARSITPSSNLAEEVRLQPEVSFAGQGGLLQTFSIRGLSGRRIQVQIDRARIRELRRAGIDATIAQPDWSSASVDARALTTTEGSGSSGGVVFLSPRIDQAGGIRMSHEGPGPRNSLAFSGRKGTVSGGLAYTDAANQQASDGTRLNNAFDILRGQLQHRFENAHHQGHTNVLASSAKTIGKSNSDFPARTTVYPENNQVFLSHESNFTSVGSFMGWLHHQTLDTEVSEDDRLSESHASSLDYGFRYLSGLQGNSWHWGADLNGRTNYDINENGTPTLDNAREMELGVFVTGDADLRFGEFDWGGRLIHIRSGAESADSYEDTSVSGHIRLNRSLGDATALQLSVHRLLNHPTAAQLYFSGTTGRGVIAGNSALNPEKGWAYEIGFDSRFDSLRINLAAYYLDFDSLIEQVALNEVTDAFLNDQGGRIRGISGQLEWTGGNTTLAAGFNHSRGKLDHGESIQDIPEAALSMSISVTLPRGQLSIAMDHRFDSDRIGSDNLPVNHRTLIGMHYQFLLRNRIQIELFGKNLLDENYRETNDRKSAFGAERTLGTALTLLF